MNAQQRPGTGRRTEPARRVGAEGEPQEISAVECPHCQAVNVDGVPFCGSCGYDFVTGAPPFEAQEEPVEARATSLQSAQPHEAYVDHAFEHEGMPSTTPVAGPQIDADDLPARPAVPPPTPPPSAAEHVAHEPVEHVPPSHRDVDEWVAELWVDHVWAATRDSGQPVPEARMPEVVKLTSHHVVIGRANVEQGLRPDLDAGTDMGVSVRHAQLTSDGERWWIEDLDTSNGTFVTTVGEPLPHKPLERGTRKRIDPDDRVYLGGWTRLQLRRLR